MDFQAIFRAALDTEENRVVALSRAVIDLRKQEVDKDTILKALECFRHVVENEEEEDMVLEVMDFLTGFCSPHLRID